MKKTVDICGIPHEIIYKDDNFTAGGDALGEIHYKDAKIYIASGQSKEMEKQTLCHEIVHGILMHIGEPGMSEDEGFVTKLGMAVAISFDPVVKTVKGK